MNRQAITELAKGLVIPATPLALDAHRKHDERRQRALLRYYLDAGVGGLAVAVHTTQFAVRDPQINLFEPILQMAAEEARQYEKTHNKTVVMVAGACGPVEQAVREAEKARDIGYDAVLLSPGGLTDYTEKDLLDRTQAVCKTLPVIGFYLQPSVGGRIFTYDYWRRFCEIDNVVAIKCASFNRYQTIDVMRAVCASGKCDDIAMYTGNDDNILIDLLSSYRFNINGKSVNKPFVGGLLGHWAVWTHSVCKLFEQIKSNGFSVTDETLTLANEITDCNAAFFDTANNFAGCIAGIHEVLRRQGLLDGIWCLNEKETLSPGQGEEIDRVYRMYPHLNDDDFVKRGLSSWLG